MRLWHTMGKSKQKFSSALGRWQKLIVTKQVIGNHEIPHPAAAPLSTDQEAGGYVSTPDGDIRHDL